MQYLEKRYQRVNEEFKGDFLQESPDERLQASVKRTVERAEFFYGRLDDRQRALITRGISTSPFDPQAWMDERLARQQDVLNQLRRWSTEQTPPDTVRAGLRSMADRMQSSVRAPYRDYQRRLFDYNCALAAELHNATTPAQRRRAARTLKGWEEDLRALMAESSAVR